ncbi:MAG: YtpR family tRNA-binding protein, partial [Noviherbaspirillum sp.]
MQFSEKWLRTMVDPKMTSDQLSHLLTMSGLEVEEVEPVAPPFTNVIVAEVLEVARHPNADRLNVCQVDAGTGTLLNIVCGAPNVRPGMKVPCAMAGAALPPGEDGKPFEIRVGKLRGVESQGMLCSARELQLSDDHGGLLELPGDAPVGMNFRDYYQLNDLKFTIKLTPNRADCLSVLGVAREVAALAGVPLKAPACPPLAPTSDEILPVRISAPDLCGRFSGRVIRGLNARAQTPEWMKRRLERSGQRSISALVDISNYVMLELGRPTHVFDLAKIEGGLDVRWGRKGESLKLLNGNTVESTRAMRVSPRCTSTLSPPRRATSDSATRTASSTAASASVTCSCARPSASCASETTSMLTPASASATSTSVAVRIPAGSPRATSLACPPCAVIPVRMNSSMLRGVCVINVPPVCSVSESSKEDFTHRSMP